MNFGQNGAQTADVLSKLGQERLRKPLAAADAILLSAGANDLFRTNASRAQVLADPFAIANRILDRLAQIVAELRRINGNARILILGGYNPVPHTPFAPLVDHYLGLWDSALAGRFAADPLVSVVPMVDAITPDRLSRYDHFHPGAEGYAEAAKRVASLLVDKAD
jgi:lysophospholipase L1-like esterase